MNLIVNHYDAGGFKQCFALSREEAADLGSVVSSIVRHMDSEKFLEKVRFKNFSEPPLVLCYYRNERVAPFKFVVPRTQTCHARGRPLQRVGAEGGVVVSAEGGVVVSAEGGVLNRYISGWAGMGADTLFAKRGIDHDTCVRIYIYIYICIYMCAHMLIPLCTKSIRSPRTKSIRSPRTK